VIVFLLVLLGLPVLIVMLRRRGTRIGQEEAERNRWQ
jgi:hypothetical protein